MTYITKYSDNNTKEDLYKNLKQSKINGEIKGIQTFRIGNFILSKHNEGFISGKIAVRRLYDDYFFSLSEGYEIETKPNELYVYDEVNFTIFPDLKIISYASKEKAKLFGMMILSKVLFGEYKKIIGLAFYPQKVLDAKKRGNFQNVWFNGVRYEGKMQYTAQYGSEIDDDIRFLDEPEKREGIGIEFRSKTGKEIKIAIYQGGTLLRHTKLKDFVDDIKLDKEIIMKFLKYSNYNEEISKSSIDEFTSLEKWI